MSPIPQTLRLFALGGLLGLSAVAAHAGMVTDKHGNVGYDTAAECDAAVETGIARFYQPDTSHAPVRRRGEASVRVMPLRDLASVAPQLARSMGYDAGAYSRGACDVGAARSGGRNHVSPPLVGKYVPFSPDLPVNVYMNRSGQPVRATMGQCDNAFSGRLPRPVNGIPQPPPPPPPPPAPPPMVCECWTDAYATQQGGACAPGQMVCRPAGQRSIIPTPVYRGPNDPR